MARQPERLIHIEGTDHLLGNQVAAAVSGDNDPKQTFIIKFVGHYQSGQAIDKGGNIGADSIIVVGTDQDQRIGFQNCRIDLFNNRPPVKTFFFFRKMLAGFIGASLAVENLTVSQ